MSLLPDPILEGVGDSLLTAADRHAYTVSVPRMYKIVGREGVKALGKYWGVAAMPKGIAAMPHIAAILQQHLAMGIAAMLLQHCNCSCIAAVLLQCRVAAILPQWGHCCNTLCALQQSAMPQRIAATLRQ